MNENEKMVLNEFNTEESLHLNGSQDGAAETSEFVAKRKNKLKIALCSSLAAVTLVTAVTAAVLHLNDPNGYDRGASQFVTDSDSVNVNSLDDGVIGMGVLYEAVTVYDGITSDASVIATLTGGTNVMIYDVSGDYFKVSNTKKTVEGYVPKESVNTGGIEIGGFRSQAPAVEINDENVGATTSKKSTTKKKTTTTTKKAASASTVNPEDFPVNSSPYFIYVEKGSHTITIYTKDTNGKYTIPSATYSTATGRTATLTPVGDFTIQAHEAWHSWGSTYSPYCSKYTSGLYFHGPIYTKKGDFSSLNEGSVADIGKNTTSGCMRTGVAAAYAVYNCPVGTNVKIVNGSPLKRSASRPSVASQKIDPSKKYVALKGISLDTTKKTLEIDDSFTVKVIFNPTNASNTRCSWSVTDKKVAEIEPSEDGTSCKITAKSAGSVTVTAESTDGSYKAKITVTVKAATTTTSTTVATTEATEEPEETTEASTVSTEEETTTTDTTTQATPDTSTTETSEPPAANTPAAE